MVAKKCLMSKHCFYSVGCPIKLFSKSQLQTAIYNTRHPRGSGLVGKGGTHDMCQIKKTPAMSHVFVPKKWISCQIYEILLAHVSILLGSSVMSLKPYIMSLVGFKKQACRCEVCTPYSDKLNPQSAPSQKDRLSLY